MTLALTLVVIVVLARWGGLIFFAYACWHVMHGDWSAAGVALLLSGFIVLVRAAANWLDWNVSGRSAWLRRREIGHSR
jgi:hypothetical protein